MKNSWLIAMGVNCNINSHWLVKTGVGYDSSPLSVNCVGFILPVVPHYLVAIGGHYAINHAFNVDIGYSHYFNHYTHPENTQGKFSINSDMLGMQLNWLMT